MRRGGWVYIMTNRRRGKLYTGMTAFLALRVHQHRTGVGAEYCTKHAINMLVHAEHFDDIVFAIRREKAIKAWRREWKLRLIEGANPDWLDLPLPIE